MIRQAEWLVAGAVSILLLWAPLPFGSVTSWSEALLEIAVFAIFALALASGEAPGVLRRSAAPAGAVAGIALLGLLQALPSPRSFAEIVSPGHVRIFSAARDLLAGPPAKDTVALSLAAGESLRAALSFAAFAAALIAAGIAGRDRRRRRAIAFSLIASALFQVLYGARRWFARSNEIWGREIAGTNERLRGTFVNPNHLAFLLGLALPVVFAWGWWSFRRAREEILLERKLLRVAPAIIVWLLLFAGLAFTGSRAGLIAGLVAVVAQGALLAAGERKRRWAAIGIAVAGIGLAVVASIGREEGFGRLTELSNGVGWTVRVEAWRATLGLVRSFPWLGTGLGSFREAFPSVQPAGLAGTWRHAHNDPLELLATAGVVGLALAVFALGAILLRLSDVFRHGRRSEDRAAALGALGALAAAGLHELVDFSLTLPANAFAVAVLLGAAVSARRNQEPHGTRNGRAAVDRGDLEQVEARRNRDRQVERRPSGGDEGSDEIAVETDLDDRAAGGHFADRDLEPPSGPGGDQLPARPPL
ncbi:MAG TPA: O-antigen ligase family protein [Thermoanaerobaculia bacterium]|jgi:O-antigen ligase|nr:O-antigen ligase family protein [Thermoanaerobaculia bacterium]